MVKVSIIVPVYKVENYLSNCIESLIGQTLKDIEIILVDDGSPDNSGKICDQYAEKDNRITVVHKTNGGVSAARNDGLKKANGDWVIFCDSDDWMDLRACEILYEAGELSQSDIVIGDVYLANKNKVEYVKFYKESFTSSNKEFLDKLIEADFYKTYCPLPSEQGPAFGYGGPWNKLVRRDVLINNNIKFDLRVKGIFDDIIFTAYCLANANKVTYIQEPVYYYRIIETSITRTYKENIKEINSAIFTCWGEFIGQYGAGGKYNKPFYANVIRRLDDSLRLYYINNNNKNSLFSSISDFKKLIRKEPYKSAIAKVDLSKLQKRHAIIVRLLRLRSILVLWMFYSLYIWKEYQK